MFKLRPRHHPLSPAWLDKLDLAVPDKRIVKNNQSTESYQRSKLALSVHKACMQASGYLGEAELTAGKVCQEVENWLEDKYEVTSADIARKAAAALRRYNPVAAYEYAPSNQNQLERDDYGFVRL